MANSGIPGRSDLKVERRQQADREPLDEGCLECAAVVRLLTEVFDVPVQVPVPDELVQAAIRVFPAAPPPAKPASAPELPILVARLTYSSLENSQPGVAAPEDVHLKYEAGSHVVEMHLEREQDSPDVLLVGQIASRSTHTAPPSRVPVRVGTPAKTVTRALTNQNGEFSLVYTPRTDRLLSIPIAAEGVTVEISLDDIPRNNS
jgi:hypothetical protein